MSKVDSLTSTPAAGLNRRGLLAAAAPSSSAVLKLRLLASAIEACGDEEEGRYEAYRRRCELLSEQVLARPVRILGRHHRNRRDCALLGGQEPRR